MTTIPYSVALAFVVHHARVHASSRGVVNYPKQQTYEEQLTGRIAAKHAVEAKQRGMPLWMLQGFPALSNEPDQDDPCDFQ